MWVLFKAKRSVLFKLHHLHSGVVHNHAVKCDVWVAWGNFPAALQEQSVTKFPVMAKRSLLTFPPSGNAQIWTCFFNITQDLDVTKEYICDSNSHDVGLVYSSHPATAFFPRQTESILSNPEGIASSDNLETFHNPRNALKKRKMEN